MVIGGLIQDQDQETVSKIPLLGDIPLLGWLFKTKHKERHEDQPADRPHPAHHQGRPGNGRSDAKPQKDRLSTMQ